MAGVLTMDTELRVRKFVRIYLTNGFRAKEAAIGAGFSFKSAKEIGQNLLNRYSVQKLIREYENKEQRKYTVNRETLLAEYDEAFEMAKHKKNAIAMVAATNSKAKLFGLEAPKKIELDGNVEHKVSVKEFDIKERIDSIVGGRINAFMQ